MFTTPENLEELKADIETHLPHLTCKIEKPLLAKEQLLVKNKTYGAVVKIKEQRIDVFLYQPKGLVVAFGAIGLLLTRLFDRRFTATRTEVYDYLSAKYYEVKKRG